MKKRYLYYIEDGPFEDQITGRWVAVGPPTFSPMRFGMLVTDRNDFYEPED